MILITITLITILTCWIQGKDVGEKLDELKNTDWNDLRIRIWQIVQKHARKLGRYLCGGCLKLWYILADSRTSTLEKALICGAIIYCVSKFSIIPMRVYKIFGIVDEGTAVLYIFNKVKDKTTPAIENKVKDTLEEWFGPEYSVSDSTV